MALAKQKPKFYSANEYLSVERESEIRHEYVNGEVYEMAGANKRHNLISANIIRLIGNQILDRSCSVYGSDMRIKIQSAEKYTYPDVVALCGPEEFEDAAEDNLLNPAVIIEVLSKTTEAYDRGAKFAYYQAIESLREYILVTQEPFRVEQFVRKDSNTWTYFEFSSADDVVKLDSIGCELTLRDIYHKVGQMLPKEVVLADRS